MVIIMLISTYDADRSSIQSFIFVTSLSSLFALACTEVFPMVILAQTFKCNLLIVLGSRLPQIYQIFKDKSTGNNAFFTWFMNFGGSAARLFTTFKVSIVRCLATSLSTFCTSYCYWFIRRFRIWWLGLWLVLRPHAMGLSCCNFWCIGTVTAKRKRNESLRDYCDTLDISNTTLYFISVSSC